MNLVLISSRGVPMMPRVLTSSRQGGTPLLEINTKFIRPATYGETIQVHTSVQEWREKVIVHKHVVMRGDTVLCEGTEVRAFCIKHPEDPDRIKAIPVPEDIKALCS